MISAWVPSGESDVEVIVGYVSGLGGRRGVVTSEEKEVSFPLDMAPSVEGYRPHVNDWVKVRSGLALAAMEMGSHGDGCNGTSLIQGYPTDSNLNSNSMIFVESVESYGYHSAYS